MKKFLVICAILGVLAVAAFVFVSMNLGKIVTAGVNRFGPSLTQTTLTLESASISPFSGVGTLNRLVIGNPKGWSESSLCVVEKIHVDVLPSSLRGDHIVVNEVILEAPVFNYETNFFASNVKDLLKNIEQAIGAAKPAGDPKSPAPAASAPTKFEVKKFRLLNGKVHVGLGVAATTVSLPPIEIDDFGTKEGGVTAAQAAAIVMNAVVGKIVGATAGAAVDLAKTGGATTAEGVKKAGEAIQGLFGGKKETKQP